MANGSFTQGMRDAAPGGIAPLLEHADRIGVIFRLGYDEAVVLTADHWVHRAWGTPRLAFLVACASDDERRVPSRVDDEELILLRVLGTVPVPGRDLDVTRVDAASALLVDAESRAPTGRGMVIDPATDEAISVAALRCRVLGTYWRDGRGILRFGSDIDTAYQSTRYHVYKPYGDSLQQLITGALAPPAPSGVADALPLGGHPPLRIDPPAKDATTASSAHGATSGGVPALITLGEVRYASTIRRQEQARMDGRSSAVAAKVHVEDFIGHKSAFFGMTRSGKSNALKVITCAVFQHAMQTGQTIGQLIFDPQGEYANRNTQDRTALAALGPEHVVRYRLGARPDECADDPGLHPLSIDLFDPALIETTWDLVCGRVGARATTSDYASSMLGADPIGPDPSDQDPEAFRLRTRSARVRALVYASLAKAGLRTRRTFGIPLNKDLRTALIAADGDLEPMLEPTKGARVGRDGVVHGLSAIGLQSVVEGIGRLLRAGNNDAAEWARDDGVRAWLDACMATNISGFRLLVPLRSFHDAQAQGDYAEAVVADLDRGKIVIVDLARGDEVVLQSLSERLVRVLLDKAGTRFRAGEPPRPVQVVVEEAHRLFARSRFTDSSADHDPWVRLAKEASKYGIGLLYATQEVSGVEQDAILSNTANWVCAHLNTHTEVNLLSKFYDFEDFAEQILRAEDPGFVRVKTRSGRFTVPVMLRLFGPDMVNEARAAAQAGEVG